MKTLAEETKLNNIEQEEYFDINKQPETEEEKKQKNTIVELSRHENLIYDILVFDEDDKPRNFVEPFMIEVRGHGKIVDYLYLQFLVIHYY